MQLIASALPSLVPLKDGLNQIGIEARIGLSKALHHLRQVKQPPRRRLFKQSDRSDHRESAMNGRSTPRPVIH